MKRIFTLVGLLIILIVPMTAVSANSTSTTLPANTPDYVNIPWSAGNAATECSQLTTLTGVTYTYGYKFDPPSGSTTNNGNTISLTNNTGEVFDFSAVPDGVAAVIVKSATYANVWTYDPQSTSDQGLHAFEYGTRCDTEDARCKYKGISHITFCWNKESKESADASAVVQSCVEGDEAEPVIIETEGVIMTVKNALSETVLVHNPTTHTNPGTYKDFPIGTYTLTYELLPGYEMPVGGLQTSFVIGLCETGKESVDASAVVQGCLVGDVFTPVVIETEGVVMTVTHPDGVTKFTHPNPVETGDNPATYKGLPVGTYTLSYQALPEYEIPTDPPLQQSFVIGLCDTDKESATASAKLGACTWTLGDGSLTPVTITVTNAKMTLNGRLYEPKVSTSVETLEATFDLKLPPGKYPYIWESIDPDLYTGAGQGTLNVDTCSPGEDEDPKPDIASSGALPSQIATAAPFLTGTLGMSLSYTILKQKFNKRH